MYLNIKLSNILAIAALIASPIVGFAQGHDSHGHDAPKTETHSAPTHEGVTHDATHSTVTTHADSSHHESGCHGAHEEKPDLTNAIMEHIGNANEFHLFGHISIPLPCILHSSNDGLTTCMSSAFEHGHKSYNKYVLYEGVVHRVNDAGLPSFPREAVEVHALHPEETKEGQIGHICYNDQKYPLEKHSVLGASTSFTDYSISKNVFSMLLSALLLCFIFFSVAKAYKVRKGQAPTGIQNFMEPVVNFIIDEVAKPMLGHNYMKFLPYLLTVFFFILANNLLGLIPMFPGGANVTGNIATTMILGLITFIITNINGNKHYWGHILAMPGVPKWLLPILTPIELLGIFTKPISLMIRLFANITAGHIIVLALVGLIFVFGQYGESVAGASAGAAVAVPFTLFLNVIELIVAFIQAFIFTILSASYFASATEEHHEHH
jgi:F-type H+-transporting ATPase subunit a